MKPSTFTSMAFVAATQILGAQAALKGKPSTIPVLNQLTSQGCYSSGANLTVITKGVDPTKVTSGYCGNVCIELGYYVMGLHVNKCYCGYVYPPSDDVTDDKACDFVCPGYGEETCGSLKTGIFAIFNTGVEIDVEEYEEPESTTSAAATSTKASTSTKAVVDETTAATASEAPTTTDSDGETDEGGSDGPNIGAIVAGVVVGVVVIAAAIGGGVFFMRRRRNAEIEEEHRRNAAVNAFINGSKPPGSSGSSGSISMSDSRLDPVMAHRRLSDGSIADDQDYSRRILRVTNA